MLDNLKDTVFIKSVVYTTGTVAIIEILMNHQNYPIVLFCGCWVYLGINAHDLWIKRPQIEKRKLVEKRLFDTLLNDAKKPHTTIPISVFLPHRRGHPTILKTYIKNRERKSKYNDETNSKRTLESSPKSDKSTKGTEEA